MSCYIILQNASLVEEKLSNLIQGAEEQKKREEKIKCVLEEDSVNGGRKREREEERERGREEERERERVFV